MFWIQSRTEEAFQIRAKKQSAGYTKPARFPLTESSRLQWPERFELQSTCKVIAFRLGHGVQSLAQFFHLFLPPSSLSLHWCVHLGLDLVSRRTAWSKPLDCQHMHQHAVDCYWTKNRTKHPPRSPSSDTLLSQVTIVSRPLESRDERQNECETDKCNLTTDNTHTCSSFATLSAL